MKYFYILMRSGFMHEVQYSEAGYQTAFQQLSSKGIIATVPKGSLVPVAINSVDVSEIFDETTYDSYVKNKRPTQYIKDGTWYDGKEHKQIRNEKWKDELTANSLKIERPAVKGAYLSKELLKKKIEEVRRNLTLSGAIKPRQ